MNQKSIEFQIHQTCNLQPGASILVGVSGGADSLALLHILNQLSFRLTAVYVDHALRPTSFQDGQHVMTLCEAWNIPFLSETVDVKSHADENKLSIEEAARNLRYRCLFEIASRMCAQAVAVAHHADDQVETVLMHLLRGSGMSGLRGMTYRMEHHAWHESIPLIRPLLNLWKADIEEYCRVNQITAVQDESNLDISFYRNRIRHALIPELLSYNPDFKTGLLRLSSILKEDYEVLENLTECQAEQVELTFDQGQATFLTAGFLAQPRSIQRMLLRKAIAYLQPTLRDIGFDAIERSIDFIESQNFSGQMDILKRLVLFMDQDRCVMMQKGQPYTCDALPLLDKAIPYPISVEECIPLNANWWFEVQRLEPDDGQQELATGPDDFCVIVDAEACGSQVWIRTIQPGDRMAALGLCGHSQKISDILINQKISRWIRPVYPMVWNEREIIWVPGYRIADAVKKTPATRQVLMLRFFKK
jgi:tRNA(Ile)-lysidine synthase